MVKIYNYYLREVILNPNRNAPEIAKSISLVLNRDIDRAVAYKNLKRLADRGILTSKLIVDGMNRKRLWFPRPQATEKINKLLTEAFGEDYGI